MICPQIRDELHYHNIRLYPFDSDDHDTEEMQLNEAIRVSLSSLPLTKTNQPHDLLMESFGTSRTWFRLQSLVRKGTWSSMVNQLEVVRTDGVSSTWKTSNIASSTIWGTFWPGKQTLYFIFWRYFKPSFLSFFTYRLFDTRTHLQDLIETTAQIHYEAFRSKQLLALKESSASKSQQPSHANGAWEKRKWLLVMKISSNFHSGHLAFARA